MRFVTALSFLMKYRHCPVKCMELFHLAVNFLTECCNTTVVLCSATQPSLAAIAANNVMECKEMAGVTAEYIEAFRRVEIEDKTNLIPGRNGN